MNGRHRYRWIGRRTLPERHGQRLRIVVARRGKFLVEFEDGLLAVTVRGTFRRVEQS